MTTDFEVLELMRCYGDLFDKALADLWEVADSVNSKRLMTAFAATYRKYSVMLHTRTRRP